MKIAQVEYSMKRVTRQYENDTATCVVHVEDGEDPMTAFEMARQACEATLATGREKSMRDKLKRLMETAHGVTQLEKFLRSMENA